jgi:SulP family sulfate permease
LALILPRFSHFLTLPGLILAATGLFYLILWASGGSVAEAGAQGWLMGPFPEGGLWQPLRPADLGQVNWTVIFGQWGSMATVLLVSVISLLLNASVIELAVKRDIDLNRELRATGIANIAAGLGAGIPGYVGISSTTLGYKIGADSRLVGLTVAIFAGLILIVGASALSVAPKVVLGGLLLFMGLEFLIEWVYNAWFKFSRSDYLIIITILLVVMLVGFLEGVIVGVVLAVILFVVTYSRVDVVKHTLSGANSYSKVVRPTLYRQLLKERGERLYILELQGFIFFGTAHRLLEQVRRRLADPERLAPHFILFDFRQVSGLDASAALSFVKIKQVAQAKNIRLVFSQLSPPMKHQLEREVFTEADNATWRLFPDLDHGLEWCETQLIQRFDEVGLSPISRAAKRNLKGLLAQSDKLSTLFDELAPAEEGHAPPEAELLAVLRPYLEEKAVNEGDYLMRQGETPTGLYFIETGQVTVRMETAEGRSVRLRRMGAGTVVGEMGFYLGAPASASVIVTHPGTVFYLSLERLAEIEATAPHLTTAFHKFMAHLQSQRLADANDTLTALLR